MRSISENDLSVVISLVAAKIKRLERSLNERGGREGDMSDEEFDEYTDDQDLLASYENILENLRDEYEESVSEDTILPSYDVLTQS